jgi:hypothetical protein
VIRLRRHLSGLLRSLAYRVNPDPPICYARVVDAKTLADAFAGQIVGRGVASRSFTPGKGTETAY